MGDQTEEEHRYARIYLEYTYILAVTVTDFKGHVKVLTVRSMKSAGLLLANLLPVLLLKRFRYVPDNMLPLAALFAVAREKRLSISRTKMIMWAD